MRTEQELVNMIDTVSHRVIKKPVKCHVCKKELSGNVSEDYVCICNQCFYIMEMNNKISAKRINAIMQAIDSYSPFILTEP